MISDHLSICMYRRRPFDEVDGGRIFEFLDDSCFVPTKYGNHEPLQTSWNRKDDFQETWNSELRQWFGMVLVKCAKPNQASFEAWMPYGPRSQSHFFTCSLPNSKKQSNERYEEVLGTTDRLFELLNFDYGYLCLNTEYRHKKISQTLIENGKILREQAVGVDWPLHIPGLYWVNYFGDAYASAGMDWESVNGPILERLSNGIRIQLSEVPEDWKEDLTGTWDKTLKQLGSGWFFSKNGEKPHLGLGDAHRGLFSQPLKKCLVSRICG